MKKMNKKGFSLVELIVVIAIMAVLVGVLAPALMGNVEKSRAQKDVSAMSEVAHAFELALADENIYDEVAGYLGTGDTAYFVYDPDGGKVTVTGCKYGSTAAAATTAINADSADNGYLAKELKAQVGTEITLSSKAYKDRNYEIKVTMKAGEAVKVEGAFAPEA